jgi:hypothetical protein
LKEEEDNYLSGSYMAKADKDSYETGNYMVEAKVSKSKTFVLLRINKDTVFI